MIHGNLILLCPLRLFANRRTFRRRVRDEAYGKFQPKRAGLHVCVPDTDAFYAEVVRAGAISLIPTIRSLRRPRRQVKAPAATRGS